MSTRTRRITQAAVTAAIVAAAAAWSFSDAFLTDALAGFRQSSVGGVFIDADGVLRDVKVDENNVLLRLRAKQIEQLPKELNVATPMRKVSLRRLQEEYAARKEKAQMPLVTEEMAYLSGLTRVQYIFVYPEEKDIVLVGPAEPIKVSKTGHMVGAETGHPVLQLDHLLIALRTSEKANRAPITCSIDPTRDGVAAFNRIMSQTKKFDRSLVRQLEQAMGLQDISITGVPASSDFARRMVAADYRMKRLAMGFEKSPVRGLPSYLSMIKSASVATPRWWLAPNYDAMLRSPDGLAWELRGPGVKVMTEDTIFNDAGGAQRTGKANPQAQRWADLMTKHYDELSTHEPAFGHLRNVMDMAVVGALLARENLLTAAGIDMSVLMNDRQINSLDDFPVPKKVPTQVSWDKKGSRYVITASGGVEINSWKVAAKSEMTKTLVPIRQSASHTGSRWWWN